MRRVVSPCRMKRPTHRRQQPQWLRQDTQRERCIRPCDFAVVSHRHNAPSERIRRRDDETRANDALDAVSLAQLTECFTQHQTDHGESADWLENHRGDLTIRRGSLGARTRLLQTQLLQLQLVAVDRAGQCALFAQLPFPLDRVTQALPRAKKGGHAGTEPDDSAAAAANFPCLAVLLRVWTEYQAGIDEDDLVVDDIELNQLRTPAVEPAQRICRLGRCSILKRVVVERARADHAHHAFGAVRGLCDGVDDAVSADGHDGRITAYDSKTAVIPARSYNASARLL